MSTLDLHGVKHKDVVDKLTDHFFWSTPDSSQYRIIIGNSQKMQDIVVEWLEEYEYKYYIPSHNLGEIRVVE